MLEDWEKCQGPRSDPSMNRHNPASEASQDISHVLASVFKDLYTKEVMSKETLSNLSKTMKGRSGYHERYIEELQQAHAEYDRRMKEADMLESHIIQARVHATASESQAAERLLQEVGETECLGLPPGKSLFVHCLDDDLLKKFNLICPQDYLPRPAPLIEAPAVKPSLNYTKPTLAYNIRTCRDPPDKGYSPTRRAEKTRHNLQEESECSLTLEKSTDTYPKRKTESERPTQVRSKRTVERSAKSRAEERAALQKLQDRQKFLRNPRFLPPNAQPGGKSLIRPQDKAGRMVCGRKKGHGRFVSIDEPTPVFQANPAVVCFTGYSVGQVYETTLELKNLTATSRHVRVIPPATPYFSIGLGRFPGESGVVAPGMSCKYTVHFAPDSLADFEDFIVAESQAQYPLLVPVMAQQPPPILTLPKVLDCGYCLTGGVKFVELLCRNEGLSTGAFCIIPKSQWPASNLRSVVTTSFAEQPPFAISPSLFELRPGETTVVEVVFFPTTAEKHSQVFAIVCNNCQVKDITIQGEGQLIALDLVSVSGEEEQPAAGELHDLTAEHFVRFSPCNPHSTQQKKLLIRNNAHLELPFHWQIMKPNLQPLLPGETPDPTHIQFHLATDNVFNVSPLTGTMAPCQDHEFLLTFCPKALKDYHSVCHLVMRDIPELQVQLSDNGAPQAPSRGPVMTDIIVMEIEVKGSTEPHQVLLEPYAIQIPGELFIGAMACREFKMWNHSKSCIFFQWERISGCHMIAVEPSAGKLEMNECFDLELVVTGGKPGRVVTSLLCHIDHHQQPITLAVEVTFKGPVVTFSVPSLDLGLVRLGDQTLTTVLLSNTTQLEASWSLEERNDNQQDIHHPQVMVEPSRGLLPAMASSSVDVVFRALSCRHFETVLELAVESGTGGHLLVQADVQSPQVCLLNCELVFSELYLGVPATGTVTLFNQTLLPASFTWTPQLQGKQASLCAVSFHPSAGTLGPNATMEITVTFTSHTDVKLNEVAALCEVQGMKLPLALGFYSKAKTIRVSYSLPTDCAVSGDQDASSLVLDFGDDVILQTAVTKQLMITNHTTIPTSFTIEVEYFTSRHVSSSEPNDQSQKRSTYKRKPLHSVQAKKEEDRAHKEFVSSLLANGKGAAFFLLPATGMLEPFETQTIDITAFNDMWGEYTDHLICRVGELEPQFISMQMTVRGCPLYFQMTGPQPRDQNQGPVVRFGTHVSGGDTVSRSLRINNPSSYDIHMDWETYNIDPDDRKPLDVVVAYEDTFRVKGADGNEVVGGASVLSDDHHQPSRDGSHTPSSERMASSIQSKADVGDEEYTTEEDNTEEESHPHPWYPNRKRLSDHIRPQRGNLSDCPYCITPQQIVVLAKGSGTIHVSFTPLTLSGPACESRCVGLALGFMSLDSKMAAGVPGKVKRAQGLDVEPVRMDLQAVIKPAVLLLQMEEEEEEEGLKFHASAADLLKGESESELSVGELYVTRSFQLRNSSEMPLHFSLGTQAPFFVLQPQPRRAQTSSSSNPSTSDSHPLVLLPQDSMQVKVAFHCSPSLLDYVSQDKEEVPPTVTMSCSAIGQKKLVFQQSLLVRHSNNSLQTVPLCAELYLATLSLAPDSIDFGSCYVGQTQVVEVKLLGDEPCGQWRVVIESDESHVFRVTPGCGVLRPHEPPLTACRQPLQISFTASEERDFRATVMVRGPLVMPPLTLQVQGRGSFNERFKSSQVSL
ncbi:deleted in lung and esophageal cancer protein 1 [Lampris incognitus]|uniref:deleted in lung and esophageal cancer protein 1 n=1 Tax=Lampris incognitus TaxID=2546036 RepID=UPI0024B5AE7A|nr:deleted in lung and esophageal cancer protein 1 [Lampris incognitus]